MASLMPKVIESPDAPAAAAVALEHGDRFADDKIGTTTISKADDEFASTVTTASDEAGWRTQIQPPHGYSLVERVGRGGFGEVWQATGPGGVPVALKFVPIHARCGEVELHALDLLKSVHHPHLLSLHGYWILRDFLVMALELADESLAAVLRRSASRGTGGLAADEVVSYLGDAAEALDYLGSPIHRVNGDTVRIQHGDVKPSNLLLQGGRLKVADYGLAKALRGMIARHSGCLTVQYASPELFRGTISASSDQYSLGATYYELRTGRRVFEGSAEEVIQAQIHAPPKLDGLGGAERHVLAHALAKNPTHRWASCAQFIGEARRAISGAS